MTPTEALRWLHQQAARIADGLDPDPRTARWAYGALLLVADEEPDAPAYLRRWRDDPTAGEEAVEALAAGGPVWIATGDSTAYYTLAAVPRPFRVPPWAPPAPTPEGVA
ncbi:hypothetical protein [Streptomyces sindenensis]|uniref:Uncharacterized protein n=1 Tax=Streptomyces sindenensis TaxID=67363 RepID=A0ABW6EU64_9ACTN